MNNDEFRKPDIIDNIQTYLDDVVNHYISTESSLDISSGYFNIGGFGRVRGSLEERLASGRGFRLRLLLGKNSIAPPVYKTFEEYRERSDRATEQMEAMTPDIESRETNREGFSLVASLLRILDRSDVEIRHNPDRFNHAKCYIFGSEMSIVGSSNFTLAGLRSNSELNAPVYTPASHNKIREWFDRMWKDADDGKDELRAALTASKFGTPPPPYEVYAKMMFEMNRPMLEGMYEGGGGRGAGSAPLAGFQNEAVAMAMQIIRNYGGAIIADSTGLGKTHIGLEVIRRKILDERKRVLLIAPRQVLRTVWGKKIEEAGIFVRTKSMDEIGRADPDDLAQYADIDMVVVDESQNFKSKGAKRRLNLMRIMKTGESEGRQKQSLLLSATPINNTIMDLYYQISVITRDDDAHFVDIGVQNLHSHMNKAAGSIDSLESGLDKIQQVLEAVMIKRTRTYIKEAYPDETIEGEPITFPEHEYAPIRYSMAELAEDVYDRLLDTIEGLHMVPYGMERYNTNLPEDERKKHGVLAGLQTVLLLKRFESSIVAVLTSIDKKIRLYRYIGEVLDDGKIISPKEFNQIMGKWSPDDAAEADLERELNEFFMDEVEKISVRRADGYDVVRMKKELAEDLEKLVSIKDYIGRLRNFDKKFDAVADRILIDRALENEGRKVLIFTEYTTTAKYIHDRLQKKFPDKVVLLITGETGDKDREERIKRFAPRANFGNPGEAEADIMVSTEVLSEGQNMQDCNYVISYDLPWSPMRIVQRIGRVDRLTSKHKVVHSRECYPAKELDKLLKLVGKLLGKIEVIDRVVGFEAHVLGKEGIERMYNKAAGAEMLERLERKADLMPTSSPLNEINRYVKKVGFGRMDAVPMGRRSGKKGGGSSAILSYVSSGERRRFYTVEFDYKTKTAKIIDNVEGLRAASCAEDTKVHMPMDGKEAQESFDQLLILNGLAKAEISKRRKEDADIARRSKSGSTSNAHKICEAMVKATSRDASRSGGVDIETARRVHDTLMTPTMRSWDDYFEGPWRAYERDADAGKLAQNIIRIFDKFKIGTNVGREQNVSDDSDEELTLVGIMFITGDKFTPLYI